MNAIAPKPDKPRILIITGNGKGKTTAAMGMALRAAGHDMDALVIQFIKNDTNTGEIAALDKLGIKTIQGGRGFIPPKDDPKFQSHRDAAAKTLALGSKTITSGKYHMVILDEICTAVSKELIAESDVLSLLGDCPGEMIVILTGRSASQGLIDAADTVSEINSAKHAYQQGYPAQKGVEF